MDSPLSRRWIASRGWGGVSLGFRPRLCPVASWYEFNTWYPHRFFRHARGKRAPRAARSVPATLDLRFRGGDGKEKTGSICLHHQLHVALKDKCVQSVNWAWGLSLI